LAISFPAGERETSFAICPNAKPSALLPLVVPEDTLLSVDDGGDRAAPFLPHSDECHKEVMAMCGLVYRHIVSTDLDGLWLLAIFDTLLKIIG
jgi:hypothetical protein